MELDTIPDYEREHVALLKKEFKKYKPLKEPVNLKDAEVKELCETFLKDKPLN